MKETLRVEKTQEALSLISGVTFSNVVGWFGASRRDLKMDLIVPRNVSVHKPCPCIVWICGGAFMAVDRSVWMPEMLRFARAGYVVASVEYRLTGDAPFPAQLIDCKSAVRYLRAHSKEYCIDPNRIFAMGESAGGALASLLGTTAGHPEFEAGEWLDYSSAVQGVVDFYGLVKVVPCADPIPGLPKWILDAFIFDNFTEADGIAASAVDYVTPDTPPVLILHGSADMVVDPAQSVLFYEALQHCGVRSDFLMLEGAIHGDDLFYQDEIVHRILAFLSEI